MKKLLVNSRTNLKITLVIIIIFKSCYALLDEKHLYVCRVVYMCRWPQPRAVLCGRGGPRYLPGCLSWRVHNHHRQHQDALLLFRVHGENTLMHRFRHWYVHCAVLCVINLTSVLFWDRDL